MLTASYQSSRPEQALRVRAWQSFAEAESELRAFLPQRTANTFLWFDWMREYWSHLGAPSRKQLLLLGVYQDETLACVAPLYVHHPLPGFPVIGILGEGYSDYLSFAGEVTSETVSAILEAAAARYAGAVFRFADLAEDDPLRLVLDQLPLLRSLTPIELYPCPYRELRPEAIASVSKSNLKFQRQVERYSSRLAQLGSLDFVCLDFDHEPEIARPFFSRLFQLHALRHEAKRNLWNSAANREFLHAVAQSPGPTGLRAFVTLLDEHVVAFELGFLAEGRFTAYITGFHPALSRFRPGHVNMRFAFNQCTACAVEMYDFSKGDDLAKRLWETGRRRSHAYLFTISRGIHSRAALTVLTALPRLLAWGRLRGFNRRLKEAIEKVSQRREEMNSGEPRKEALRSPHKLIPEGEFHPFQFAAVADLPVPELTQIIDFAFAHTLEGRIEFCRMPDRIIVRRTDQTDQLEVHIPRQP